MLGLHWDHAFHALHVSEKREGRRGSRTVISMLHNLSESLGVQVMKCLATVVSLPEEMSLK